MLDMICQISIIYIIVIWISDKLLEKKIVLQLYAFTKKWSLSFENIVL